MNRARRQTALITGSSRGLGFTLADFLAAQGHDLILTARDQEVLENSAAKLRETARGQIVTLAGDVGEAEHRSALIEKVGELGGLDLLVNNASDLGPSPQPLLRDYPLGRLEHLYRVNVFAPLGLIQGALPLLREDGLVVNISSDAAVGAYEGWGGYGSSKAALDLLTLTLANEGVNAVSVDPGDMRTAMHQAAFPGEDISDRPLPDVTLPFWAWLLGQDPKEVSGQRFQAQGERWETKRESREVSV